MSIETRHCICCDTEIQRIDVNADTRPHQGMWLNGTVDKIRVNYGSVLDGRVYLIAICDTCLKAKEESGTAEFLYDYMAGS